MAIRHDTRLCFAQQQSISSGKYCRDHFATFRTGCHEVDSDSGGIGNFFLGGEVVEAHKVVQSRNETLREGLVLRFQCIPLHIGLVGKNRRHCRNSTAWVGAMGRPLSGKCLGV